MYVAKDLRMPQFELENVEAKFCDNKIHMGELEEEGGGLPLEGRMRREIITAEGKSRREINKYEGKAQEGYYYN